MSLRSLGAALLLMPGLLIPFCAQAVSTWEVVHRKPEAFGRGELDHIVVTDEGHLTLSPVYGKMIDLPDPIIWKTASDAKNNVFMATGNDGRVYRLKQGADKAEVFADFGELQVLALAVDPKGVLYAGTSPDGRIYRVIEGKPPEVFADPEAKYLWDMTFDREGELLVATGQPGGVLGIRPDQQIRKLLPVEETHILCLAVDGMGQVYAGSADNGYVFRFQPGKADAAPFVLLDAPGDEVKQLLPTPDGAIIALTLGPPGSAKTEPLLSGLLARATSPDKDSGTERDTRIYRLAPNRAPEELWFAPGLTAHSIGYYRGQVLAGVGEEGKIVAIGPDRRLSFLADASGEQVTSMVPGPNDSLLIAVSNPAALFKMEARFSERGVYTSEVIDSDLFATWGRIDVREVLPAGGTVTVQTRSGNTDKPNATWSPWIDLGDAVASPPSRYLQYRLTLKAKGPSVPRVREVAAYYLPVNSAPTLGEIVVLDPGVRLDRKEEFRTDPEPKGINRPMLPKIRPQLKEKEEHQTQSARWEGSDVDQDQLRYTVSLREAGSTSWRVLEVDLTDEFINFNATALADGWYELKVVARDAPGNQAGEIRQADRLSVPFPIDHSPPTLTGASVKVSGLKATVSLEARDQTTYISDGRYSVDGGPFVPLFPEDRVLDEKEERFTFTTVDLPAGAHTLVVAVEDGVHNIVTGKYPVVIK